MTPEQVVKVIQSYRKELEDYPPVRDEENYLYRDEFLGYRKPYSKALSHASWMCLQVEGFVADGRIEKAMRWLGFIQAILWMCHRRTIEKMREDNASG